MTRVLFLVLLLLTNSCFGGANAQAAKEPTFKHVALQGEVNDAMATKVILGILLAPMGPEKTRPDGIIIDIDSGGGDFDAGFEIVKAIEASPIPVICVVDGQADSMAFYILQSCDQRVMTRRSSLMWHGITLVGGSGVNMVNLPGLQKRLEVMNEAALAHVSHRLKIPASEVAEKIKYGDWWMAATEALKVGAVDSLIR